MRCSRCVGKGTCLPCTKARILNRKRVKVRSNQSHCLFTYFMLYLSMIGTSLYWYILGWIIYKGYTITSTICPQQCSQGWLSLLPNYSPLALLYNLILPQSLSSLILWSTSWSSPLPLFFRSTSSAVYFPTSSWRVTIPCPCIPFYHFLDWFRFFLLSIFCYVFQFVAYQLCCVFDYCVYISHQVSVLLFLL